MRTSRIAALAALALVLGCAAVHAAEGDYSERGLKGGACRETGARVTLPYPASCLGWLPPWRPRTPPAAAARTH